MKSMNFLAAAALAAATFSPVAMTSAFAAEVQVGAANCNLNARQAAAGWTCTAEAEVTNVSRVIGNGSRCQDASSSVTTYRAYNPAGKIAEDKTIVVGDSELSDWGSSYPIGLGCNHPTI